LQEHGYRLVTAANGHDGLQLFMTRRVDAIVLEYYLGLLDGAVIADVIKQVRPEVPIVMLADHVDLPGDALRSVDALVTKSDGPHFLLAVVHSVLNRRPQARARCRVKRVSRERVLPLQDAFSAEIWTRIRDGTVHF
jgi:DNA-binding response OmpR family regulator